jgi:hypothetical protein
LGLIKNLSVLLFLLSSGCGLLYKKSESPHFDTRHAYSCGPDALYEAFVKLDINVSKAEISNVVLYRQRLPGIAGRIFISPEITSIQEMIDAAKYYGVIMIETDEHWEELRSRRFVVIVLGTIRGTVLWHYTCVPPEGNIEEYLVVKKTWWLIRR